MPSCASGSESPAPRASFVLKHSGAVIAGGIIVTALVALVGIFWAPRWKAFALTGAQVTPAERSEAEQAVRETAVKLATGIGAGFAGVLAWGRLDLSRQEHGVARESHFTERYIQSIDKLGHDSDDVVLGSLFALERLGVDSESDRRTITELLTALIRSHADPGADSPPAIVQAATTILGRADWKTFVNLSGLSLRGVDFSDANFSEVNLSDADLAFAVFQGTNLRKANMAGANLERAWFGGADLSQADLRGCSLQGTRIHTATLTETQLDAEVDLAELRAERTRPLASRSPRSALKLTHQADHVFPEE
jgi:hypothetical protein